MSDDPGSELAPEAAAWLADRAVPVARLADSTAASAAAARLAAGTLSPAAREAITRASARSAPASPTDQDAGDDAPGDTGHDGPDVALSAFGGATAGARVIGLGTALPGTHELATLGHRFALHLVAEHGVRTLALDASASTTTVLDRHVRYGGSTAADVLDRLGAPEWCIREGVAVIDALRTLNGERAPEDQVRIVGLDPVRPAYSVRVVAGVLRTALPDAMGELSRDLSGLVEDGAVDAGTAAAVDGMARHLEDPAVAAAVDPALLDEARRHVPLLRRAIAYATAGADAPVVRERLMAERLDEVADGAAPVLLWGHADHVLVDDDPVPTLGHHLRAALGDGYYALGLLAGAGACLVARKRRFSGASRALQRHRFPAAPDLAAELGAATRGDHLVDLRAGRADAPTAVTRWWDGWHQTRVIPSEITTRSTPPLRPLLPGQAADGWVTVAQVRAAAAP